MFPVLIKINYKPTNAVYVSWQSLPHRWGFLAATAHVLRHVDMTVASVAAAEGTQRAAGCVRSIHRRPAAADAIVHSWCTDNLPHIIAW